MKREFSLKQIMQMILVCLLLVAVVYIFYRADHAELSQLNGPVTASQGAAPLENESDPALRSFTYLLDKGESTEYYLNYEDNPVMRYIANYKTFEASDGTQQRVLMSFQVPPAGKEADNLSLLVSTQSYPDVMSMTYFGGSLAELYEAGNILDLGPYIDQYMPNYKAWLEANPQVIATTPVGDQDLHLTLTGIRANLSAYDLFAGWCYRRDWIVRYGVQPDMLFDPMVDSEPRPNPKAGQAFSGHYTLDKDGNAIESATLEANVNGDSWVDDVIFPSGNTDPIYISDWEWMFEIFERALKEQGIADGYVTSVYYPGFNHFNPRSPHGERLRKVTILSIRIIGFAQKVYHKTVLLRISLAENAVILPEKPRNPVRTSLQKAGGLRFARAIRAARPYSISSPSGA